jgi:hypothetical protein
MRLTGLLFAAAAALSMIASPALAQPANPAAKLSLNSGDSVRAGAPTKKSSKAISGAPLLFLGLAVTATVVGIAVGTSHSGSKAASA